MCRELCGCSYGYGHANSPRRFHPTETLGFFIAVSINRRVIVFGETPLGDDGKPRLINTGPQPIVATQHIEPG